MRHVVEMKWLSEHLDDPGVRVIDCRFDLGNPDIGRADYLKSHIPGAFYFDLEKDMSAPRSGHGGRHPLPDVNSFAKKLGETGIDEKVKVVAYDDQGGTMAARLWWMLQYLGHREAHVLEGPFSLWQALGYPVTAEIPQAHPAVFHPSVQHGMLVDVTEVEAALDQPGIALIDAREEKRFKGQEEPIDPVAGHIPGASNYFWREGLDGEGRWLPPEKQKERFVKLQSCDEVIAYCGSGVSACANVLALKEAGIDNVKLYVGSWSDWISYGKNPIETEEA